MWLKIQIHKISGLFPRRQPLPTTLLTTHAGRFLLSVQTFLGLFHWTREPGAHCIQQDALL